MADEQYTLLCELGTGTWGTVYAARTPAGDHVALKVLHPVWERHPGAREALQRTIDRLAASPHPGVARPLALVRLAGRSALLSEAVDGPNLGTLLRETRAHAEPLSLRFALEVCAQCAETLAALQHQPQPGLAHGDLKPTNIAIDPTGQVRLLDFATAPPEAEHAEAFTQSVRYGSLRYQPPERGQGARSDLYALGGVLHELVLGRPFPNAHPDPTAHAEAVQRAQRSVRERRDPAAEPTAELLGLALAHAPMSRPSALAFAQHARAALARAGGPGIAETITNFPLSATPISGARQIAADPQKPSSSLPAWQPWAIAGLTTLAGALLLAAWAQ